MSDELNFVMQARREKLAALEAAGVAPFAYAFDRTHQCVPAAALLPAELSANAASVATFGPGGVVLPGRHRRWPDDVARGRLSLCGERAQARILAPRRVLRVLVPVDSQTAANIP